MFQEQAKLCWEVLEHQAVLISLLQFPHMLLGTSKHTSHTAHLLVTIHHFKTTCCPWDGVITHFVLDLPPGQLTHQKLYQHVEERPQVVVATHLLQNYTRFEFAAPTNQDRD